MNAQDSPRQLESRAEDSPTQPEDRQAATGHAADYSHDKQPIIIPVRLFLQLSGLSWLILAPSWAILEVSGDPFGPSWSHLEAKSLQETSIQICLLSYLAVPVEFWIPFWGLISPLRAL